VIVTRAVSNPLTVSYASSTYVPVSINGFTAAGNTVNLALNYAPVTGTQLTVINNTGLSFINGTFSNLSQGQAVALSYNGVTYQFVANYYGGTGNDLVLTWAGTRPFAWGDGLAGQLGNNSTTGSSIPVAVTTTGMPLANRTVLSLSVGYQHSLALCSDGTLAAWGFNAFGELGNNSTTNSSVPVAVTIVGTPLVGKVVCAMSSGSDHNLVLCTDGTLASWGSNSYGQLGNSTTATSTVPVAVTTAGTPLAGKSVAALGAGSGHSLVLCSDGTLASWGYNTYGQLGNNATTNSSVAVAVTTAGTPLAGKTVISFAAGGNHNIALCSDGTLVTWGENNYGQLGNNTTTNSTVPILVTTAGTALAGKTVIAVAAGQYHSMALCSDGTLATWGYNTYGQLGNNTTTNSGVPVAVTTVGTPLAGKTVVALTAGVYHSAATCADGTAAAWGYDNFGQLGNNSFTQSNVPVAVNTSALGANEKFMLVASGQGAYHTLSLVATPVPVATTLAATSVGGSTAILNGTVNANGGNTAVSFDYGLDTTYGTNVAATPATVTGSTSTAVSAALTGLLPSTTYHYRINVSNSGELATGSDMTFTTPNTTLSGLVLSTGALSPVFSPTVYSYTTAVGTSVASTTLTPTTADTNATVTINGNAVISGNSSSPIALNYGDNTLNIVVTASNHVSTQTYSVIVTRAVSNPLTASYASSTNIPVNINGFTATGSTVNFALNYAPVTGAQLTVVNNTGLGFINGTFSNLAQGQAVALSYNGVTYQFVANYYGGTGNDLVLMWAGSRPVAWGWNTAGELGNNSTTDSHIPTAVTTTGTPLSALPVLALSAGWEHSLALCSDGSMASWGLNAVGQLGNNTTTNSSVPVAVITVGTPLAGKIVSSVSSGYEHNLALCTDGTLASWGYNLYGQLGNTTTTNSSTPVAVTTVGSPLAGKNLVSVVAGGYHNIALCSDGTLASWGYNSDGQLGNNTTINSSVPVTVTVAGTPLAGKTVVSVAAGGYHNIALCSDGTLVSWGWNQYGQLGNNSTIQSNVPVAVTTTGTALAGKTVIAVAAGVDHSLALCSDGTIAAWGWNAFGQLGNNTTTNSLVPVAVINSGVLFGKTVVGLAVGIDQSMAACSDGTIAAWGLNSNGQLGNNTTTNSLVPVAVSTTSLGAGESFMLVAGGQSAYHCLGLVATPVPTVTTLAATSVAGTTAVLNGTVNANGGNAAVSFDYGLDTTYGTNVAGSPAIVTGSTSTAVSAALTGLAPLTTYHYRVNASNSGELANGSDLTFTTPNNNANLTALALNTSSLSPGFSPTVFSYTASVGAAVTSLTVTPTIADSNATMTVNGTAIASGSTSSPIALSYGNTAINIVVTAADQVAIQTYTISVSRAVSNPLTASYASSSSIPVNINGFTATGNSVNFALNYAPAPGTLLTVVNNTGLGFISGAFSNLSHGQTIGLSYNGVTYKFVANYYGGTGNDLVLMWAGTRPVAWGYNTAGELGNNSTTDSPIPVAVTTAGTALATRTVLALSSGWEHSLALCSDGTLASWGYNLYGQLGNNTTTNSSVPVTVTTTGTPLAGKIVSAVTAGYEHNLALCTDGTLASWGYNAYGQLGNNATTNSSVPVAVTTAGTALAGKSAVAISTGTYHSLTLCSDGSLAAWGYNTYGQLGNNSTTQSTAPVAVTTAGTPLEGKTVVSAAAGGYHNIALCSDGTLVTWGENNYGQLGNNTTANSSVPVAVITAGTALAGKTVIAVAAGQYHSLALCSDGTLAAWGYNTYGQLGNNSTAQSLVPVAVTTSGVLAGKTVVALTAGYYHSVASCTDGTVTTWGYDVNGQLGNNSTTQSNVPVAVSTTPLAAGEKFMLVASGQSANHSLGLVAAPVPGATTLAASALSGTSAVLNGTVNANGGSAAVSFDYGLDTTYGTNVAGTPATVTGSTTTAVSVALTGLTPSTTYHFRVNGTDGSGTSNGGDMTFSTPNASLSSLALSTGSLSPAFSPSVYNYTVAVGSGVSSLTVTPATVDSNSTVAVNSTAVSSGSASSPVALGYGDNTIRIVVTASDHVSTQIYSVVVPRTIPNPVTASFASGTDTPINVNGFTATGNTLNFALNYSPVPGTQLTVVNNTGLGFINGTFSNLTQGQNVMLSYNGVSYKFVANYYGGTGNDLVLVWAGTRPVSWGYNTAGELGNNSTTTSSIPVAVTTTGTPLATRTLLALCSGNEHSLGLFADGTLASWGYNAQGQLGNNTTTSSSVAVAVTTAGTPLAGKVVSAVSAGLYHSLALCSDGTLSSWGYNAYGQLGNNTTTNNGLPVAVTTAGTPLAGKPVVAISAGTYHSQALCSDGTLVSWGYNTYGNLGNNTTTNSSVPVAVTTAGTALAGKSVVAVAAGGNHTLALCSDGILVAWGQNNNGQLGNNTTTNSSVPVAVTTAGTVLAGKTVIAVGAGRFHSLALCSDGTTATWGSNIYGQLGNGTTTQSTVPVAVTTAGTALAGKTVVALTAGFYHSVATCSDGSVAAWGYNVNGQLGNNSTTPSSIPVAVSTSSLAAGERFMLVASGQSAYHSLSLVATPLPPVAITLAATSVTGTTAILNGTVNSNGASTAVSFDYGLTTSYDTNVAGTPATATGSNSTAVSLALTGLLPATTYHFRVNSTGGSAPANGADMTFTTPAPVTATTLSATTITGTTAVLNGTINANGGSAAVSFDYGLDTTYGTNVAGSPATVTGSTSTAVSVALTGLTPATTYHFRVNGASSSSTVSGADMTFTTPDSNANLAGLTLSSGTLSPVFSGSVLTYAVLMPNATTSFTVTPTAASSLAGITVNGTVVASGAASASLGFSGNSATVSIVVTAKDGATNNTYTLNINRYVSFLDWAAANNLSITGYTADTDGDGIPNLLEYAFNSSPTSADRNILPTTANTLNAADGKHYFTYTYRRRIVPGTLTYVIQSSADLSSWSAVAAQNLQQVGSATATGDGVSEVVTFRLLPALEDAPAASFVRLQVTP